MSSEIKLLEAIRDTLQVGVEAIVGQIGASNARLEAKIDETSSRLETKIDETNTRLGNVEVGLGAIEHRVANTERQLEQTNHKLDTIVGMFSDANNALSIHGDIVDQRITDLEGRVDKLEEAS